MNGILLIDKPKGFTSFDVIAKLRGMLKTKRIGHSGTLDPMATGVLPVFIGKATKACDILPNNEKSYTAGFVFGNITDTQDTTGKVLKEFSKFPLKEEIEKEIINFKGEIDQIPPMYSAVSINGQRLYDLARKGIEVERKPRKIRIDDIDCLEYCEKTREGKLFIKCSKGTYIRTIINDIGENLGCGGVMSSLVRNSSSGYKLCDCLSLDLVQKYCDKKTIEQYIIPIDTAFEIYQKVMLSEVQTRMYKNGVKLDLNRVEFDKGNILYRVYSFDNEFIGIGKADYDKEELFAFKNFF